MLEGIKRIEVINIEEDLGTRKQKLQLALDGRNDVLR